MSNWNHIVREHLAVLRLPPEREMEIVEEQALRLEAAQSTLYGTGALSLPVLLGVGLVLLGAALVACYAPARRASAADPMIVLRQE